MTDAATLDAVSTLLAAGAHHAVSLSLPRVLSLVPATDKPTANQQNVVEAHLRALKALFTDLVRVVGPREWGTEVIGASIDAIERRDAESLWSCPPAQEPPEGPQPAGKGKARETDMQVDGAAGSAVTLDVQQLQAAAFRVLAEAYGAKSATSVPTVGSSSAVAADSRGKASPSPTLDALLSLLIWSAQEERQASRTAELVCSFFAGTMRWPSQRAAVEMDERNRAVLDALKTLVEKGSDKVSSTALHVPARSLRSLIRLGRSARVP